MLFSQLFNAHIQTVLPFGKFLGPKQGFRHLRPDRKEQE